MIVSFQRALAHLAIAAVIVVGTGCSKMRTLPTEYVTLHHSAIPALQGRSVEIRTIPQATVTHTHGEAGLIQLLPLWHRAVTRTDLFADRATSVDFHAPIMPPGFNPLISACMTVFGQALQHSDPGLLLIRTDFGPSLSDYNVVIHNSGTRVVNADMHYFTGLLGFFLTAFLPIPVNQLDVDADIEVEVWRNLPERELLFSRQYVYSESMFYGAYILRDRTGAWQESIVRFNERILRDIETSLTEPSWSEEDIVAADDRREEIVEASPVSLAPYLMNAQTAGNSVVRGLAEDLHPLDRMDLVLHIRQSDPHHLLGPQVDRVLHELVSSP